MRRNPTLCKVCNQQPYRHFWQPDFAKGTTLIFHRPGQHERGGFITVWICDICKDTLCNGGTLTFSYRKDTYRANSTTLERFMPDETEMAEEQCIPEDEQEVREAVPASA